MKVYIDDREQDKINHYNVEIHNTYVRDLVGQTTVSLSKGKI